MSGQGQKFFILMMYYNAILAKAKNASGTMILPPPQCLRNCLKHSYLKTLLAAFLLTFSLAANALTWTDPNTGIKWTYTKVNGTASIGGGKRSSPAVPTSQSGDLIVPEKINGLAVTQMKAYAFYECTQLTSITFTSDIAVPADASWLFYDCYKITEINLEKINTSKATTLHAAFNGCEQISNCEGLRNWDVSKVNGMNYLFSDCKKITDFTPIANWNVANVTRMMQMFDGCGITSLVPLAGWDMSSVTDMRGMFRNCTGIESLAPLSQWDISKITNLTKTFYGCSNLTDISGLQTWDVSNITIMNSIFYGCKNLTDLSPIGNWNVSNVKSLSGAFGSTNIYNLTPLANWNVANVTDMSGMLQYTSKLEDISALANWDVSNVTNMVCLFYNSNIADITPLTNWNVANVIDMSGMFRYCKNITDLSPIAGWNVSNVTSMEYIFQCSGIWNLEPLAEWDVSKVKDMMYAFYYTNISDITPLDNWNMSNVTNMDYMFYGCSNITSIDLQNWNLSNLKHAEKFICDDKNNVEKIAPRVRLPQNMTIIPEKMFSHTWIKELTIPSTVTKIELYALPDLILRQITIPAKVTEIQENWCFSNSSAYEEIFCMPETPPVIESMTTGKINKTLYVKTSALEAYRADPQWSRFAVITDQIPVTIAAGKQYATLALDFDADFSQTEGLTPYTAAAYYEGTTAAAKVASAYQQAGMPAKARAAAKDNTIRTVVIAKFPDNYIPSRTGKDNFTFHGALLYGKPGTYYYRMGEDDYASGQQKTEIGQNNYMMPAYETWQLSPTYTEEPQNWMCYPKDDSYNFVLKDGKFKYIDNAGTIARHKAWLALPREIVHGSYHEAGAKMSMVFEDADPNSAETTGITFIEETVDPKTGQTAYNLRGQAVTDSYKGIIVRNGKAFLNNK